MSAVGALLWVGCAVVMAACFAAGWYARALYQRLKD